MSRALLVVDVQNEYFTGKLPVSYPIDSLANVLAAMDGAQVSGTPIVVIRHASPLPNSPVFRRDSEEWQLHSDVARRPRDLLIDKQWPDSFHLTGLGAWLIQQHIDTVSIAGYMTQQCCQTTAWRAWHLGYRVEFLADGTGTLDRPGFAGPVAAQALHQAILATMGRFAEVVTTADWLTRLR